MRAKTFFLAMIVLLVAALLVAGCGGGGGATSNVKDKAELTTALGNFEMSAGAVTQALAKTAGCSVTDALKAADKDMGPKWKNVTDLAKKMGWKDAKAGDDAWKAVDKAINSIPAGATLAQAQAALSIPMDTLMEVDAELRTLVQSGK